MEDRVAAPAGFQRRFLVGYIPAQAFNAQLRKPRILPSRQAAHGNPFREQQLYNGPAQEAAAAGD